MMPRKHALRPGGVRIPRAFADHRTVAGHRYRAYTTAILARLGPLSADGMVTLREAGRVVVELELLSEDLEAVRKDRRAAERIRRRQFALREQLGRLEGRLESLTAQRRPAADPVAAVHAAVQRANGSAAREDV